MMMMMIFLKKSVNNIRYKRYKNFFHISLFLVVCLLFIYCEQPKSYKDESNIYFKNVEVPRLFRGSQISDIL